MRELPGAVTDALMLTGRWPFDAAHDVSIATAIVTSTSAPGSRRVAPDAPGVIRDSGHATTVDQPEALNRVLLAFWSALD